VTEAENSIENSALAELAGQRAENYFQAHGLSCSEAVLLVINRGFGGGLTDEEALALGSGFGGGVGDSGCLCGAISGAVMALGLFMGPGRKEGLAKKKFRKLVGSLHNNFQNEQGAVCCRDLIVDFRKDRKGRASFCRGLTGRCAAEAVRLILGERPELAAGVDREFLAGNDSKTSALLSRVLGKWLGKSGE